MTSVPVTQTFERAASDVRRPHFWDHVLFALTCFFMVGSLFSFTPAAGSFRMCGMDCFFLSAVVRDRNISVRSLLLLLGTAFSAASLGYVLWSRWGYFAVAAAVTLASFNYTLVVLARRRDRLIRQGS